MSTIVGVEVLKTADGFSLSQPRLIKTVLERFWSGGPTTDTPLPANYNATTNEIDPAVDPGKYLSILGSLSYLAVGTRPDIAFAVNFLSRFLASPNNTHWKGVQHLLSYIAGLKEVCLDLFPKDDGQALKCYCDASWGGEFSRAAHGIFLTFFSCPILWIARRQTTVAASTCHAEFMALGLGIRNLLWVINLIEDCTGERYVGHLLCDNASAIKVATDDPSNKRTRHTDRDFFITNEALFKGQTAVQWIPSGDQLADILTKPLGRECFGRLRRAILRK